MKMEIKMFYQETLPQNSFYASNHTNTQLLANTPILAPTLYREVTTKKEISITRRQLAEITKLYSDSFSKKPGWLRQKFYIDQRRKKHLNNLLYESGLDNSWCGHCCAMDNWAGMLHSFWHEINGEQLCK